MGLGLCLLRRQRRGHGRPRGAQRGRRQREPGRHQAPDGVERLQGCHRHERAGGAGRHRGPARGEGGGGGAAPGHHPHGLPDAPHDRAGSHEDHPQALPGLEGADHNAERQRRRGDHLRGPQERLQRLRQQALQADGAHRPHQPAGPDAPVPAPGAGREAARAHPAGDPTTLRHRSAEAGEDADRAPARPGHDPVLRHRRVHGALGLHHHASDHRDARPALLAIRRQRRCAWRLQSRNDR
mmetsp:Transcript_12315/g.29245  ORF Transcript_12315/g.29245 Transcript_12315/m.29245 type:complete len:240 (+) Transcript_12315:1984-2703(+)